MAADVGSMLRYRTRFDVRRLQVGGAAVPQSLNPGGGSAEGGPSSSPPPPLLAVPSLLPPFAIDRYQKLIPGTPPFRSSAALCSHGAAHGAARGDSPGGGWGAGGGALKLRGTAGFAARPVVKFGGSPPQPPRSAGVHPVIVVADCRGAMRRRW